MDDLRRNKLMTYDITIIIPLYNMGYIIEDTLRSLSGQTDTRFKVLIVDDGSTDNSHEVIKQWQESQLLEIEYIFQSNSGVSAARNKGIDSCDSPYIIFCDADDILPPYTVELIHKYIDHYDVVAGKASRQMTSIDNNDSELSTFENIYNLLENFLYNNSDLHFCSFVYKRELINKYQIRFSNDLKYGEDEEFTWKYLCHCTSALFINKTTYIYRINPNSATNCLSFARTQVIDSMIRVSKYYSHYNHAFTEQLENLGIPRAKLAILKNFAVAKRYDLYRRLINSEDYKTYGIHRLFLFPNIKIKLTSILFCLSSPLCYYIMNKFL